MSADFDLAVLGGGPAGAAAALGAARAGLSVALFEPQTELADKPCGEGILPAGVAALRELGFDELVRRAAPLERLRYVLAGGRELPITFARQLEIGQRLRLLLGLGFQAQSGACFDRVIVHRLELLARVVATVNDLADAVTDACSASR